MIYKCSVKRCSAVDWEPISDMYNYYGSRRPTVRRRRPCDYALNDKPDQKGVSDHADRRGEFQSLIRINGKSNGGD